MSVAMALASALMYGLSDFLGGLLSRRTNVWVIAFGSQVVSAVLIILIAAASGGDPTAADLLWGAASGLGSGLGTVFLYRGLAGGQMNVVAPLSAVGAALLPVVVGIGFGERPSALAWLGILCALPAIWLVSRSGAHDATVTPGGQGAIRDGLLAGAGFGLLFVALGQVSEGAGLWPLAAGQSVAVLLLAVGAVVAGAPLRSTAADRWRGAALVGVCSAAATGLYQVAVRGELVSITAVLASLYPALTVLLAAVFLHERVHRVQAIGLALAAGAVTLVALG